MIDIVDGKIVLWWQSSAAPSQCIKLSLGQYLECAEGAKNETDLHRRVLDVATIRPMTERERSIVGYNPPPNKQIQGETVGAHNLKSRTYNKVLAKNV